MPRAATLTLLTALAVSAAGAWANAATTEDRYGPPPPADAATPAADPVSGWLSWSTKTVQQPSAQHAYPPAPRSIAVDPAPAAEIARAPRPERVATAALPTGLYSVYPAASARPVTAESDLQRPAAEDRAPPRWSPASRVAAAPSAAAPSTGQAPHFYSVHREFGLTPDPIPLPSQFFADSADLAAPPPPLPPRPFTGSQAATSPANTPANRARATAVQTADSAAD